MRRKKYKKTSVTIASIWKRILPHPLRQNDIFEKPSIRYKPLWSLLYGIEFRLHPLRQNDLFEKPSIRYKLLQSLLYGSEFRPHPSHVQHLPKWFPAGETPSVFTILQMAARSVLRCQGCKLLDLSPRIATSSLRPLQSPVI